MPKELPEVNKLEELLVDWEKLCGFFGDIANPSYHGKVFIQRAYALGKKEVLEGIKNGTICSSCGEPMEQGLSEWCGQCLENN